MKRKKKFTMLFRKKLARYSAPLEPIEFDPMVSVVSVCSKIMKLEMIEINKE